MASDGAFPYATSQTGLKRILEGIPGWVSPTKVTGSWLAGVGFAGGTAAQSLAAMRGVGIVGSGGQPTELWAALRAKDRAKFATGIRKHYAELFATYADAHRKDTEALLAFVRSKTTYGDATQQRAVATFKTFCEFGDFDADAPVEDETDDKPAKVSRSKTSSKMKEGTGGTRSVALTVNIQLQLPENASGDVYEKLFAAMEKHLKGLIGTE